MVERVAVIGAGLMGRSIGLACALGGGVVSLTDAEERQLAEAPLKIRDHVDVLVDEGLVGEEQKEAVLSRITYVKDCQETVTGAQLVIEAVTENLAVKQELLERIEEWCSPETILTSNSSTFPISRMAQTLNNPERACGFHWYNPAHLVPLVEIIPSDATSGEIVEELRLFASRAHKVPVVCKESPGFLGVRLQTALTTEAIRMLEEGLATPEDIDKAVKYGFGFRLALFGPLTVMDYGGLDTFLYSGEFLANSLGERYRPPKFLYDLVAQGKLGLKSGEGFFDYRAEDTAALTEQRDRKIISLLKSLGFGTGR